MVRVDQVGNDEPPGEDGGERHHGEADPELQARRWLVD